MAAVDTSSGMLFFQLTVVLGKYEYFLQSDAAFLQKYTDQLDGRMCLIVIRIGVFFVCFFNLFLTICNYISLSDLWPKYGTQYHLLKMNRMWNISDNGVADDICCQPSSCLLQDLMNKRVEIQAVTLFSHSHLISLFTFSFVIFHIQVVTAIQILNSFWAWQIIF